MRPAYVTVSPVSQRSSLTVFPRHKVYVPLAVSTETQPPPDQAYICQGQPIRSTFFKVRWGILLQTEGELGAVGPVIGKNEYFKRITQSYSSESKK